MLPLLYLTFESTGHLLSYASYDVEYYRLEAETNVKTTHAVCFHLMGTWVMFLIVTPFRAMASTKAMYTFRLDLFSRVQFITGVLATTSCILLFAARSSFKWQTYQRYLLFFIKSLWGVIIYVEVIR